LVEWKKNLDLRVIQWKSLPLVDVLKFMETDEILASGVALKDGTAINLFIYDLPRNFC